MFSYDAQTGALIWLRGRERGNAAGTRRKDQMQVQLWGTKYIVSRIIWKLVTGVDPISLIDHEDGNPFNNSWSNLREATHPDNGANRRKHKATHNNLKGTYQVSSGKWAAAVTRNYKRYYLGQFDTEQDAHDAYVATARKLHKAFHRS